MTGEKTTIINLDSLFFPLLNSSVQLAINPRMLPITLPELYRQF